MKTLKNGWIYYLPIIGFILFVYKSEKYDYNNREILSQPPIVHIGETPATELAFVLTHGLTFGCTLAYVVVSIILS